MTTRANRLGWLICAALLTAAEAPSAGADEVPAGGAVALAPRAVAYRHEEGLRLKSPRGAWYDPATGEVYVCDTGNGLVAVFDREARPAFAFGYGGELVDPVGVAVDPDGRIYIIEGRPRTLSVFTPRGERAGPFPFEGRGPGPAPVPGAVATDDEGRVYVGDDARGEVLVYGRDWRLERRFGKPGGNAGEFKAIVAIAPAGARVFVMDATAIAIQVFDRAGRFQFGFGEHQMGPGNFSLPAGLAVDGDGRLFAVDMIRHEIKCLGADGKVHGIFGGLGAAPGNVWQPSGIACDGKGRFFVVEQAGGRLQALDRTIRPPKAAPQTAPASTTVTARAPEDERERARREALAAARKLGSAKERTGAGARD